MTLDHPIAAPIYLIRPEWKQSRTGKQDRFQAIWDHIFMATFADVFNAAQALSAEDQFRLIEALWDNIPMGEWPSPSAEWIAEAQRRSAEYDAGTMSASPWPDVYARALQKAGLDG
jgi:putative addiction module component (TIGR02574 family)